MHKYLVYGYIALVLTVVGGFVAWNVAIEFTESGVECRSKGGQISLDGSCTRLELRHIELDKK